MPNTHTSLLLYVIHRSWKAVHSPFSSIFGGAEGYTFVKQQNEHFTEADNCVSHRWLVWTLYMQHNSVMLLPSSCSDQSPN